MTDTLLGPDALDLDLAAEVEKITAGLRAYLRANNRRGFVVALSGGIDSSLTVALAVSAVGPERVLGLHMPERESSGETLGISRSVSDAFGIDSVVEDITAPLEAVGAYRRRDDAIRLVVPDYGPGHRSKIVLPSVVDSDSYRLYSVVVVDPAGNRSTHRLTPQAYLGIVAATNFKQRVRKQLEYYHADRLNYATTATPNRLEYDQGFFVKLGDGAGDVKPIAHLYKTQVYALAAHLGVPQAVLDRPSTTDTYSLEQSQEEFYFALPHRDMDLVLYGKNQGLAPAAVAPSVGLSTQEVARVYADIDQKRRTTAYLHRRPVLSDAVPEIV